MAKLTEVQVIRLMRNEYHKRLIETIGEADMFDDEGNHLLSPGLKVRHKDSKFEYTVDSVEGEKDSENAKVTLKLPDEPRFDPPEEPSTMISDEVNHNSVMGEGDPQVSAPGDYNVSAVEDNESLHVTVEPEGETEFVIDQEEFEKEYEVT